MAKGWRIVLEARVHDAFSGEGAQLYGGRWNSPGYAVVYASEHKSLAALEQLVHLNPRFGNRFKAFLFQFPNSMLHRIGPAELPGNWRQEPPPLSTQAMGEAWVRNGRSAVLAVPSIIIPEERNYLLNPEHPDFRKITIKPPRNFAFDPRLLSGYE